MRPIILTSSLLALASVFTALPGCKRDELPPDDAKQEIDPQIKELEEAFQLFGTWQKYMETIEAPRRSGFYEDIMSCKIKRIKDPVVRTKYFRRFSDLAFSVQIDATDPATRSYQLKSFNRMTDIAEGCAESSNDVDGAWSITLRRLKIFKEEMQRVEAFFEGKGYGDTFKGGCDVWQDYREKVKGMYKNEDKLVSIYFRDTRTADGLTYERWHYLHSQFEEILGHKVEVWSCVLEKWEKERKKRAEADKAKEMK